MDKGPEVGGSKESRRQGGGGTVQVKGESGGAAAGRCRPHRLWDFILS